MKTICINNTLRIATLILLLAIGDGTPLRAQTAAIPFRYPEIGHPCPDYLLTNLQYYPQSEAPVSAFKGKWVIIDFWTRYCIACIESFPKLNALQEEFKDRLQVVLVGKLDPEKKIMTLYEKHRKNWRLRLAVSYDSVFFQHMNLPGVPYQIIVDDQGIVRALTIGLDRADLVSLMAGKNPETRHAIRRDQQAEFPYDPNRFLLTGGNGGHDTDFLYRSLLSKWTTGMDIEWPPYMETVMSRRPAKLELIGADLYTLYRYAYLGKTGWMPANDPGTSLMPVFETTDTALFQSDFVHGRNFFNYSLSVPPSRAEPAAVQRMMQIDLERYFGFTGAVEERDVPCWKLVATEAARTRLKTREGPKEWEETATGLRIRNQPIKTLQTHLWIFRQDGPLYIDETGITGNIDVDIPATFMDLEETRKALKTVGLDLVWGKKRMKTLVIRKGETGPPRVSGKPQ